MMIIMMISRAKNGITIVNRNIEILIFDDKTDANKNFKRILNNRIDKPMSYLMIKKGANKNFKCILQVSNASVIFGRGFYGSWVLWVVGFPGRRFYGSVSRVVGVTGRRFYG